MICFAFVCTDAIAQQTNDVENPPVAKARGKRRAKKGGDELEQVTAQFKKEAQRDRLPGLPDRSEFDLKSDINDAKDLVTFEAHPKNNDFVYHFEYARADKGKRGWKLKKAWRTDKENHVKEYPVETAEN